MLRKYFKIYEMKIWDDMKKSGFSGYVYDFSVDYTAITVWY